ncbi:MAG TPA: cytochrome c oxidase assembly protein [Caulobacteraceae bacterium]|nr:cytochrome c oxidase assembly protein [Caulobacteraceae bacterium]
MGGLCIGKAALSWEGAPILRGYRYHPYCGAPPAPDGWALRWNLDPLLILALAGLLAAYLVLSERRERPWRRAAFCAGWFAAAAAWVSPLCALSVSLFSARVGQHMWLAAVAAPLIALGRPTRAVARLIHVSDSREQPVLAAAAFAIAMWIWHTPAPYTATFESDWVYWLMHATTLTTAIWLWSSLLEGPDRGIGGFALATLLTTGQMGLLGALITFAGQPLYPPHAVTPYLWGLTPLQDQQLGGVIMWIPAGVIFAGGFCLAFLRLLRRAEARLIGQAA